MTFFIASLRKNNTKPTLVKSTRLALELIEIFPTNMKNSKDPRIEEVQIPREMAQWETSMSSLSGALVHGQEMVNHFTIELARGLNEIPSYTPFATGNLSGGHLVPTEPASTRAQELWKKASSAQKTHQASNVVSALRFDIRAICARRLSRRSVGPLRCPSGATAPPGDPPIYCRGRKCYGRNGVWPFGSNDH